MAANDFFNKDKEFLILDDKFLMIFTECSEDDEQLLSKINTDKTIGLRSFYDTFYFEKKHQFFFKPNNQDDIQNDYIGMAAFVIGKVVGNYIKLDKEVFKIESNIYMDKNLNFNASRVNYFYKYPNISLIKILAKYTKNDIYIDNSFSDEEGHIDKKIFDVFKKAIPTSTEIQHYKFNEIDNVLSDYFNDTLDYSTLLENIKNKRINFNANSFMLEQISTFDEAGKVDIEKYRFILENLQNMLRMNIKEKNWQKALLPYIRLLYPQYIYIIDEVGIIDIKDKNRRLDYLLVDYSGNVDIIELKIPSVNLLRETLYRDNYIESRELVGSIMQCEKYLYDLTSNREKNEIKIKEYLFKKYKIDIDIQIVRPHAIIIAGRSNKYTDNMIKDFRIIKRKYSNIADIISYDDLLNRLNHLINSVDKKEE